MVASAAIDTREVTSGSVFFAMAVQHVDGHSFLGKALSRGARIAVVSRADDEVRAEFEANAAGDCALVLEEVTAAALARWRSTTARVDRPVIGVTLGSGKTTTKDFLRSFWLPASRWSPPTATATTNGRAAHAAARDRSCGAVVGEMAMRGVGQIAELCDIAGPRTSGWSPTSDQPHRAPGLPGGDSGRQGRAARAPAGQRPRIPQRGRRVVGAPRGAGRGTVTWYGLEEKADVRVVDLATTRPVSCLASRCTARPATSTWTLEYPGATTPTTRPPPLP